MVISFLDLCSICLSSSLVHFKKGPEYLTRDTAQVFIPEIRILLDSFVSSSFSRWFLTEVCATFSSSLQDTSQNSHRAQQSCSLDGYPLSSYFQALQFLYQTIWWDCTERNQLQLVSPSLSRSIVSFSSLKSKYLSLFLLSFSITCTQLGGQSPQFVRSSIFCGLSLDLEDRPRFHDPCVSQNVREFCTSHILGRILGCK